jgi:hypothetical protein
MEKSGNLYIAHADNLGTCDDLAAVDGRLRNDGSPVSACYCSVCLQ